MFEDTTPIAEYIRRRPGMYIGDTGPAGVAHLVKELVANSVDQYIAGQATRVIVSQEGHQIGVTDDGPGLPYDQRDDDGRVLAESYFVRLHQTPTADGHSPHIHLNPLGLGLVVVSTLSSHLEVVTHRAGYRWCQRFEKGVSVAEPTRTKSNDRGTSITFTADGELLSAQEPHWGMLRHKLFEAAHLFPGLTVGCRGELFQAPGGLLDYAHFMAAGQQGRPVGEPAVQLTTEMDGIYIVAAACGTAKECQWYSWCNGLRTDQHGTHMEGFRDVLRGVRWTPAAAMIHVRFSDPRFAGPVRSKIINKNVRASVRRAIKAYLKVNPLKPERGTF